MIYILGIVTIILCIINLIVAIKNNEAEEYKTNFIVCSVIIIITIILCMFGEKQIETKQNYIQNIEEKLNIYEQDYDKFVLEDSKLQGATYEK